MDRPLPRLQLSRFSAADHARLSRAVRDTFWRHGVMRLTLTALRRGSRYGDPAR